MTYSITIADRQPKTYQKLDAATAYADAAAVDLGIEVEVIHQETGVVTYVTSLRAIRKRDEGEWFVPWTRLETPKFSAPHFDTHYPAYTRKRIPAVVYRVHDLEAAKAAGLKPWLVWDGRTGNSVTVDNTTQSRHLLTEMKQGRHL
jgi:hypothetical protein